MSSPHPNNPQGPPTGRRDHGHAGGRPLRNYADFSGRARRSEFWWFYLFNVVVSILASLVNLAIGFPALQIVAGLGLLIVWWATDDQPRPNRFGAPPKAGYGY